MGGDFVPEADGVHVKRVFVCASACKWDIKILLVPSGGLCEV